MRSGVSPLAYREWRLDRISSRLTLLASVGSGKYPPIASHSYWRWNQETNFRGEPTVTQSLSEAPPQVSSSSIQPVGQSVISTSSSTSLHALPSLTLLHLRPVLHPKL